MRYQKKKLIALSKKVLEKKPLSPQEISYFLSFEKIDKERRLVGIFKTLAVPLSLLFGFFFTVFPDDFAQLSDNLPSWTNFSTPLLAGVNYLWDLLGDPVEKNNILFHIPNIILYSFGILGIKKLIDLLERKTWMDKVLQAKEKLKENILSGMQNLHLQKGHSILFVGKGDFIGMQFTLNKQADETVTVSQMKPSYTDIWSFYDVETLYDDLKNVILRSSGDNVGEYVFFPVKDNQIFLPGEKEYDLSPHKLDILCQNIRTIEKEQKWKARKILIIGDKFHKSYVRSEDQEQVIKKSEDIISIASVASKYPNVSIIDPSDIVVKKILAISKERKIVFRATKEGIKEYKKRFYGRLKEFGYKSQSRVKGVLTIGYDLFEDQTEQQTLSRKIDDYFPVVLSKNVKDALVRNGYIEKEFLYVPELVLQTLSKAAAQQ